MTFGIQIGPPAVRPHWLKMLCDFFWPALFVNQGVAASLETWLNS